MNIIGEGIQDFVSEQIRTRQIIYGAGITSNRTPEQIEYLNSKTAFVKLVSSVNLEDSFTASSAELKELKKTYGSNNLAKEFILFNGTTNSNNTQRFGINTSGNLINNSAAYGLGGLEFGFRPMSGITSAEIKTETRGTLKTATVNIKAWNRVQFEIIDLLYLRLGYSVLLEWGNTIYFDNNSTLVKQQPNSISKEFLDGNLDVDQVLSQIQEKRKISNGNYDALYGRVVNFSWDFSEDGSYNINLIIRSIGDVIESLKMNVLVDDKLNINKPQNPPNNTGGDKQTEPDTIESYADKSQIGKLFYYVKKVLSAKPPTNNNGSVSITSIANDKTGENLLYSPDIEQKKNFLKQIFEGKTEPEYYIRLGALFAYIQNKILTKYDGKTPVLNINYQENNYIYTTFNQISMDPRVCLIKTQIGPTTSGNTYYYASEGEDYIKEIAGYKVGQVMNIYVNFMYVLTVIDDNLDNKGKCSLISFLRALLGGINKSLGGVNNLDTHIEEDKNLLIIDQNPLPGKNDILTALNRKNSNNVDITTINLYGYYNNNTTAGFVRNFGLKTEITPDLASLLTIGAQAAGSVVGEDSTALSKLNEGLKDRIAPTKTDANGTPSTESTPQEKLAELKERFSNAKKNFDKALFELGSENNSTLPIWNDSNIENYTQLQLDFVAYNAAKKAITEKKASNHIGFIPVSLNLTLDGISGFKIYNALKVDTTYLPSNYPTTMDFLITGVSHKITNDNVWITDLTTVMVPKDPSQSDNIVTDLGNNNRTERASNRNRNCAAENQQLSANYTLSQLSCGAPAAQYFVPLEGEIKRNSRGNFTRQQIIDNLRAVAQNIAEPIRSKFPTVIITNGYRNKGGDSQHEIGQAIDIQFTDIVGPITNQNTVMLKRAQEIKKLLDERKRNGYDQLLLEYKTNNRPWIHISYRKDGRNRNQVKTFLNDVTAQKGNGILYNPLV